MDEIWFPSKEAGANVVGQVSETKTIDIVESEKQKTSCWKMVPVLLSKIPGKSHDVSSQAIKPHNKAEICGRFPGAWEAYEARKAQHVTGSVIPAAAVASMSGTPIDKADFLPRDKISWLITLGFTTIEQIAAMDDNTVQNLRGAATWRKKAIEFLKRT